MEDCQEKGRGPPALRTQWKTARRRGGGCTETPSGHSGRLPGEGEGTTSPQDTVEDCQEKGRGPPALRTQWKTARRRGGGCTETPSGHSGRLPGEGEGAVRKHQPSGHSGRLPGEGEGAVRKHPQDTVEDCQEKGRGLYGNTSPQDTVEDCQEKGRGLYGHPHSTGLIPSYPPALGHVAVSHFSVPQVREKEARKNTALQAAALYPKDKDSACFCLQEIINYMVCFSIGTHWNSK